MTKEKQREWVWVNGVEQNSISAFDRGLQYGDGLFETMAVVNGAIRRVDLHLNRLELGCAQLGIHCPPRQLLLHEFSSAIAQSYSPSVLKLILTRGVSSRGYQSSEHISPTRILSVYAWPAHPPEWRETGVAVRWCQTLLSHQPLLAGLKHLNRLEQVLARREWSDPDIAEGLMSDPDGHVIGGTMTNLFVVQRDELCTPRLDCCGVAGTMRAAVLSVAKELGIPTSEQDLSRNDLQHADEVFLTNALIEIWAVRRIEDRRLTAGPVARRLRDSLSFQ